MRLFFRVFFGRVRNLAGHEAVGVLLKDTAAGAPTKIHGLPAIERAGIPRRVVLDEAAASGAPVSGRRGHV